MGPPQYPWLWSPDQEPQRRFRPRCCLLKGCERSFLPLQPQSRYCSEACQKAARRWRRWYAGARYRASVQGKERRRAQSRRYRERRRQQALTVVASSSSAAAMTPAASTQPSALPREGQRPARRLRNFVWRPCRRPGCYSLFPVRPRSPSQHFCSCPCRQALRRVLDREAHWRRRHRCPRRQATPRGQPPPDSS